MQRVCAPAPFSYPLFYLSALAPLAAPNVSSVTPALKRISFLTADELCFSWSEVFRSSQRSLWSSVRPDLAASTYMMSFCLLCWPRHSNLKKKNPEPDARRSLSSQKKVNYIVLTLCFYSVSYYLCVCHLLRLGQRRCWGMFTGIWGSFVVKSH